MGDLTQPADVARAVEGVRRMYFGMSVSAPYLEATAIAAAVARERGDLEVFVNISQMTVSQMSLTKMTDSPQQRQHWLAEQVLNWSGLPVVHVRPTVFLQHFFFLAWAAESIARDGTIRLPFGSGQNISRRYARRGGGDRDDSGESDRPRRQGLRADRAAVARHACAGGGVCGSAASPRSLRRRSVRTMARRASHVATYREHVFAPLADDGEATCRQSLRPAHA